MNKPKNHSDVFLKKFLTLTLDALGMNRYWFRF